MLAWLDQADAGMVLAAAAKLVLVAAEIKKVGEELKTRPQWVSWKGEGADAFRTWSADLANATLRLADYSSGASKWLTEAAGTIGSVQASIPRDTKYGQSALSKAQANLEAAKATPKDPDSASVTRDSTRDIETVLAKREAERQEAARQMKKLGESYTLSAEQMDALEKPKFPPPPKAVMPRKDIRTSEAIERSGGASGVGTTGTAGSVTAGGRAGDSVNQGDGARGSVGAPETSPNAPGEPAGGAARPQPPTGMEIDSGAALSDVPTTPSGPSSGPPMAGGRPEGTATMPPGVVPPMAGGAQRPTGPSAGAGRPSPGFRPPVGPGQTPMGTGPSAQRPAPGGGITGGRPVAPSPRRGTGGIPRGTVIGGEDVHGRGPVGQPVGTGRPGAVQGGPGGGRRIAGQPEGIVGGRPQGPGGVNARPIGAGGPTTARGTAPSASSGGTGGRRFASETGGIVGGRPQQAGTRSARPFTPGGSGAVHGAPGGSGRPAGPAAQGGTRGGQPVSGAVRRTGEPQHGAGPVGRGGPAVPPGSRSAESRREDRRGERPDYLTEDEETWQQGARRATPPVVD
jgi:hypothetical protein